jgi:hypothetical protein
MTTKKVRTGYRLSIFWEEFGTLNEGGMEDTRDIELISKPTKKEMDLIERLLTEALRAKGRLRKPQEVK